MTISQCYFYNTKAKLLFVSLLNSLLQTANKVSVIKKALQVTKLKWLLTVLIFNTQALAQSQGVTKDSIVFGQSAALTGVAKHLGLNMKAGLLAVFNHVNQQGGIKGRKLKLISLDDFYEPEQAIKNTRELIDKHKVFSLIGAVGTPTSKAVVPLAQEFSIPYIGPFTGAKFLRELKQTQVINVRASYSQEIDFLVNKLISELGIRRISILYQDDSYGRAGLNSLKQVLKQKNMEITSRGSYMRNTTAVKTALLDIMKGDPETVLIVGAYRPAATFVKLAEKLNFKPLFLSISFVGTSALYELLENHPAPVLISQVVPFPSSLSNPLVKSCQDLIKTPLNFVSLEACLVAKFTVKALQQTPDPLNSKNFLQTIKRVKKFSIHGFQLEYGLNDNQGTDKVFLSAIFNGKLFPVFNLKEIARKQEN